SGDPAERLRATAAGAAGEAAGRRVEGAAILLLPEPAAWLLGRAPGSPASPAAAADHRSAARAPAEGHRPGAGRRVLGTGTAEGGLLVPSAAGGGLGPGQPSPQVSTGVVQRPRHDHRVRPAFFSAGIAWRDLRIRRPPCGTHVADFVCQDTCRTHRP